MRWIESRYIPRLRTLLACGALALGALTGCSDNTSAGATRVSVLLTDAPGSVKQAVVTISEIYLQGSGGRVVLMSTPVTTDLLTLASTTAQLVQDAVVPSGTYAQLRFVVTGGYIAVDNGNGTTSIYASSPSYAGLPAGTQVTGVLQMPSDAQSGIKVTMPDGAVRVSGSQKILLVDFDVSRSFGRQAGASGQWVMTPVLNATDLQLSGSATVSLRKDASVTLPSVNGTPITLGDFTAALTAADGTVKQAAFTDADGDGTYETAFQNLLPGMYTVSITGPAGVTFGTSPASPVVLTVASGQDASQAFTITSASGQ